MKPKYTLRHSTVIDAGPDTVWTEIRDVVRLVKILFGDTVENVRWIEGGTPEQVPARYDFTMVPTKDVIQQEVAARNEVARSLTHRTVAPTMFLDDYVASFRVQPVTTDPDRSYLEWSREFTVAADAPPEFVDGFLAMLRNQVNVVQAYFAKP